MDTLDSSTGGESRGLGAGWRLVGVLVVLVCVSTLCAWLLSSVEEVLAPLYSRWGGLIVALALAAFIVLLSVPFLPGVELGWAIMMVFGSSGVLLVYSAALIALTLSYFVGKKIRLTVVARALGWLRFRRAATWVADLAPLPPEAQLTLLLQSAPARWVPFLVRHRYVALALLLNLPGNTVLGGGGGIALLAGLSRQFAYPRFLLTVSLAIVPVPLVIIANQLPLRWLPW